MRYTKPYDLDGTNTVHWDFTNIHRAILDRETLRVTVSGMVKIPSHGFPHLCSISSKTGIFQKFDQIIAAAKKKNKI